MDNEDEEMRSEGYKKYKLHKPIKGANINIRKERGSDNKNQYKKIKQNNMIAIRKSIIVREKKQYPKQRRTK
jgi:hypothetical protein